MDQESETSLGLYFFKNDLNPTLKHSITVGTKSLDKWEKNLGNKRPMCMGGYPLYALTRSIPFWALPPFRSTATLQEHCHPSGAIPPFRSTMPPFRITATLQEHCHPSGALPPFRSTLRSAAFQNEEKKHKTVLIFIEKRVLNKIKIVSKFKIL